MRRIGVLSGVRPEAVAQHVDQLANALVREPVIDGCSVAAGLDESPFAQPSQMLGHAGLRLPAQLHHLSDGKFSLGQPAEDQQALFIREQLQDARRMGGMRGELSKGGIKGYHLVAGFPSSRSTT